jgi:hypothetical protein
MGFVAETLYRHPFELAHIEVEIDSLVFKEFLMGSLFDNGSVVDDKYQVGVPNGAQPVGDNKACSSGHEPEQRFLDAEFGSGVDAACRFVENQNVGVQKNNPCNCQ